MPSRRRILKPFLGKFADFPASDPRRGPIVVAFAALHTPVLRKIRRKLQDLAAAKPVSAAVFPPWFGDEAQAQQTASIRRLAAAFRSKTPAIDLLQTDDFSFGLAHVANAALVEAVSARGCIDQDLRAASAAFRMAYDTLTCRPAEAS